MPLHCLSHFLLSVFAALFVGLAYCFKRDILALWTHEQDKMPETHHLVLPDGRQLAYAIYGAQHTTTTNNNNSSPTILYFHGTPSSHHEAFLLSAAARRHGIRIVAPSRPGSGGSGFNPRGTLLAYADDVLALADHLGLARFAVVAVSGGAPYAFACRRCIPRARLAGLGIVAGVYPVASLGAKGMQLPSRVMMWVAAWFPGVVAWVIDRQLGAVARDEDEGRMEALLVGDMKQRQGEAAERERLAWERAGPEIRGAVVMGVREGVRYGGRGPAWEMRLLGSPWGFELEEIQPSKPGEIVMWHGDEDANVPLGMAKRATEKLGPLAELRIVEGQGHGTLTFDKADEIIRTMKSILGSC
ncbi:hypothetical protein VTK56DRAFT_3085 [Thermocarpiscus australiensis]